MKTTSDTQRSKASANRTSAQRRKREPASQGFVDNRPDAASQRVMQSAADRSPQIARLSQLKAMADNSPRSLVQASIQQMVDTSSRTAEQPNAFATQLKKGSELDEPKQMKVEDELGKTGQLKADDELDKPKQMKADDELDKTSQLKGLDDLEKPKQMKVDDELDKASQLKSDSGNENRTGLPDSLKAGVESLSGMPMDDVKVHYNSSKPAALQALAHTQGTDIHVGPGQEQHLAHEAWHVAQQKQGRVRPTMKVGSTQVNDDASLEHEADVMGQRASAQRFMSSSVQLQAGGALALSQQGSFADSLAQLSIGHVAQREITRESVARLFSAIKAGITLTDLLSWVDTVLATVPLWVAESTIGVAIAQVVTSVGKVGLAIRDVTLKSAAAKEDLMADIEAQHTAESARIEKQKRGVNLNVAIAGLVGRVMELVARVGTLITLATTGAGTADQILGKAIVATVSAGLAILEKVAKAALENMKAQAYKDIDRQPLLDTD